MGTWTMPFDSEALARGWDGVLEKTREKLNEARAKSLELSDEARARSIELATEASKLGDSLAQRVKEAVVTPADAQSAEDETGRLLEEGCKEDGDAEAAAPTAAWWSQVVDDQQQLLSGLANRLSDGSKAATESVAGLGKKFGDRSMELGRKVGDSSREVSTSIVGFGKKLGDSSKEFASMFSSSLADTRECGLSRSQRFRYYVVLLFVSTGFFCLSFQLFIFPSKFAAAFALGTITSIAAKAMLNGPYTQLRLMFQWRKLPYTLALVLTITLNLYLCLTKANALLILAGSLAQIAALVYYLFGDTPGGKAGIKILFKLIVNMAKVIARPFVYAFQ